MDFTTAYACYGFGARRARARMYGFSHIEILLRRKISTQKQVGSLQKTRKNRYKRLKSGKCKIKKKEKKEKKEKKKSIQRLFVTPFVFALLPPPVRAAKR